MKNIALIAATALLSLNAAQAADGAKVYATCAACHQATGQGIPGAFPPLAESEWVNGPVENLIRIQLRGLMGPITVKGTTYNSVMPPNASMSDEDIAAVLTYIRSNFGNDASAVTPDMVKALRSEVGKPMLKAEELVDPTKVEEKKEEAAPASSSTETPAPAAAAVPAEPKSGEVIKSEKLAGPNYKVWGGLAAWGALCIIPVITGIGRRA
ncbi:c-type cytochrome [Rubritalea marina]|uniref:c-type cytochrome n=1 Tax=Rubritalea marina TaxID=361055 RepID=UPI000373CE01|nr:cytochrome c [Rubritalea marina]